MINYSKTYYIMDKKVNIIIMAGGDGKRMQSDVPKVLVKLGQYPMLIHILQQINILNNSLLINNIYIVVGKHKDIIEQTVHSYIHLFSFLHFKIHYVKQNEAKGTGYAIQCCKPYLERNSNEYSIILSGDVPLISFNTLLKYYRFCSLSDSKASLISTKLENPTGYGRIVEDNNNEFKKIVEEKDCNNQQKYIKKINAGLYCFQNDSIINYINKIDCNNGQNEYYLTDIFELLVKDNIKVDVYNLEEKFIHEIMGVNTIEQLNELERIMNQH